MRTLKLNPAMEGAVLLTFEEARTYLRVGETTMKKLIATGQLRSVKLGRRRLITRKAIEQFAAELDSQGGDAA